MGEVKRTYVVKIALVKDAAFAGVEHDAHGDGALPNGTAEAVFRHVAGERGGDIEPVQQCLSQQQCRCVRDVDEGCPSDQ